MLHLLYGKTHELSQIGKFTECASSVSSNLACAAVVSVKIGLLSFPFVVSKKFCDWGRLLKFKVRSREISHTRQIFQSSAQHRFCTQTDVIFGKSGHCHKRKADVVKF